MASHQGKERVVPTLADPPAGMDARPPLAHEDAASRHGLAAVGLHAEPLGLGVPAVPR